MLAFSLSRNDYREYDQQISFYTKEAGKLEIVARGVKKSVAKNAPALEPFSLLEIEVTPGKNISYVTKSQIKKPLPRIRQSYKSIIVGGEVISLVDKAIEPGVKDERIFNLLDSFLSFLNENEGSDSLYAAFTFKLLRLLGFSPNLSKCSVCGNALDKYFFFDIANGSAFCDKCNSKGEEYTVADLKMLTKLQNSSWEDLGYANVSTGVSNLIRRYGEYHLAQKMPNYRLN